MLKKELKENDNRLLPEEEIRQQEAAVAVTAAEKYAVKVVQEHVDKERVPEMVKREVFRRTADILLKHRQEVRDMYRTSKALLRQWILERSGADSAGGFQRMRRMGLNGDIRHDMEILEMAAGRRAKDGR